MIVKVPRKPKAFELVRLTIQRRMRVGGLKVFEINGWWDDELKKWDGLQVKRWDKVIDWVIIKNKYAKRSVYDND